MEKRLNIRLNANRTVRGVLRGYDEFMNLVLDNTEEVVSADEVNELGMVVIRGNSIIEIESLDKLTS
jgi:small nuclear ribonucleoprotein G